MGRMITITHRGSTKKTDSFLRAMRERKMFQQLDGLCAEGVRALAAATPKDSGATAAGWGYKISQSSGRFTITWTNNNVNDGVPIAVILQYGHGTGTGGYVQGQDYINPALKPVFDKIADKAWKVVTSA